MNVLKIHTNVFIKVYQIVTLLKNALFYELFIFWAPNQPKQQRYYALQITNLTLKVEINIGQIGTA